MTTPTEIQYGGFQQYQVTSRPKALNSIFRFSERFYPSPDPKYDALMYLGAQMNHNGAAMNLTNSWCWTGFSKKGRMVAKLYPIRCYGWIEKAGSYEGEYASMQGAVSHIDYGEQNMPDLSYEGILGWLETITFMESSLDSYREVSWLKSDNPMEHNKQEITKPITFWHRSDNYQEAHSAWMNFQLQAYVRWFA